MTQEEYNALGLSHVNLDVPGTNRSIALRRAFSGWSGGAFQFNTQTPLPNQNQIWIPVNNFRQLQYFDRPGPNTSTSQFNPTNKYSTVLQILQAALATRDPNGNNGLF